MKYYARGNYYGSDTSHGFANTNYVLVFESRAARDAWVDSAHDLSACAIRRAEATYIATNLSLTQNRTNAPEPFSGEFWGIEDDEDDIDGCIGQLVCCDPDSRAERFYN